MMPQERDERIKSYLTHKRPGSSLANRATYINYTQISATKYENLARYSFHDTLFPPPAAQRHVDKVASCPKMVRSSREKKDEKDQNGQKGAAKAAKELETLWMETMKINEVSWLHVYGVCFAAKLNFWPLVHFRGKELDIFISYRIGCGILRYSKATKRLDTKGDFWVETSRVCDARALPSAPGTSLEEAKARAARDTQRSWHLHVFAKLRTFLIRNFSFSFGKLENSPCLFEQSNHVESIWGTACVQSSCSRGRGATSSWPAGVSCQRRDLGSRLGSRRTSKLQSCSWHCSQLICRRSVEGFQKSENVCVQDRCLRAPQICRRRPQVEL